MSLCPVLLSMFIELHADCWFLVSTHISNSSKRIDYKLIQVCVRVKVCIIVEPRCKSNWGEINHRHNESYKVLLVC
jgi:hypothetical protein